MDRAYGFLQVKSLDDAKRVLTGIANTISTDRQDDIVVPKGAQFNLPIPFLWQHDSSQPIGKVTKATVTGGKIEVEVQLAQVDEPGTLKDRLDEAWQSIKAGLVQGLSIGFKGLEVEDIEGTWGMRFTKWLWLELSAVTIPANGDCSIQTIKSIDKLQREAAGEEVPAFAVGDPVESLADHMPGMKGMTGKVAIVKDGPYYAIQFDDPMKGIKEPHKWLAESELKPAKKASEMQMAASGHRLRVAPLATQQSPGVSGTKPKPQKGNQMKTVSEQITDMQNTRAAKAARMSECMSKSLTEGTTTDAAEGEEFDNLEREIKQIDIDLKRLAVLQELQKGSATAVGDGNSTQTASAARGGFATVRTPVKSAPGIDFARWAMCLGKAHGNLEMAAALAKEHYGQIENVNMAFKGMREMGLNTFFKSLVTKTAVPAATSTDATYGGPLMAYIQFAGDFVEFLRPQSIIGKFGTTQNGVSIPDLNHIPFNVHIRGQTSGGAGYWVGQGQAKPLTRTDFNDTYLGFTKLANIAVLTEELMRFSDPAAETLIRNMLAGAIVQRMDADFIDPTNAGVANVKPASITYGATTVASTGALVDNIRQDIDALWNTAAVANLPMDSAVYITDARTARRISLLQTSLGQPQFAGVTMRGGALDGVPIIVSNNVPTPTAGSIIVLAFASEIWLADDGQVSLAASTEASLEMNSAPTSNSTTPTAVQMVSMFQTDSVALRAERYINWAKRRAQAVAYVTGVNYTP